MVPRTSHTTSLDVEIEMRSSQTPHEYAITSTLCIMSSLDEISNLDHGMSHCGMTITRVNKGNESSNKGDL